MDYFKFLPAEITLDILSRLPIESILESKLVCTTWRNHVRHPSFSKMHLHHLHHPFTAAHDSSGKLGFVVDAISNDDKYHYFECNQNDDDDELTTPVNRIKMINLTFPVKGSRFVGSCNGLMCFARGALVWFCNPITREYVMLPKINSYCSNVYLYECWNVGFGYVSATNKYKVVAVGVHVTGTSSEVYIYTLGNGKSWRELGKFNYGWVTNRYQLQGIFANEALYWLDTRLAKIISFKLAEEKFSQHLLPSPSPQDWRDRLGVLDGFLSFAVYLDVEGDRYNDIWLLKKKKNEIHEMKEKEEHRSLVWSREFRIDKSNLFAVMKSDRVLTYGYNCLNVYDTKTSTSKSLVRFKSCVLRVSPHQNTFVSLKQLGEEDTKTMEEARSREDANSDFIYLQTGNLR